jgi:curved DNA-binding protein CbpA/Mrp family chromosome partitioning ATPase
MSSTDLKNVEPHSPRNDKITSDIDSTKPREDESVATDYYEILRIGPRADIDTIERVYHTLAERFRPDNSNTGDAGAFQLLQEAYGVLSDHVKRAEYNALRRDAKGSARFWLRGREFFDGVRGGQNRRLAVLCLLYRRRVSSHEAPGLTILDLEKLTGCTREELTSALWYLCEKQWAEIGELTDYSITVEGFEVVESRIDDRSEFRAFATVSYYGTPTDTAAEGARKNLRSDIELAMASDAGGSVADHYQILGIGPKADEETIERVYRSLASRLSLDNPGSGEAKTFSQIKEAYETLSDSNRRAQYDALQQSEHSARFRLRGREFFDGVRGEKLRRLAVLCLLYRRAAGEFPGLKVFDLEQLTGCTREELGPALWYLREKKWVKLGEFTEYSITAAGFDVVETKLDEHEAAQKFSGGLAAVPASPKAPPSIAEIQNSPRLVESEQADTKAEEPSNMPNVFRRFFGGPETPTSLSLLESTTSDSENPLSRLIAHEEEIEDDETEETAKAEESLEVARGAVPAEEASVAAEQLARIADRVMRFDASPEPATSPSSLSTAADGDSNARQVEASTEVIAVAVAAPEVKAVESAKPHEPTVPSPAPVESAPVVAREASHITIAEKHESTPPAVPVDPRPEVAPQPTAVSRTISSADATPVHEARPGVSTGKRVILSMGGKGGVGKTSVMTGLAEWFEANQIPLKMLDLDIENKACGSLTHFFGGRVPKINIHTPAGLDAFVDHLGEDSPVILADMGAGQVAHDWFEKMYPDVAEFGVAFTAIGVVTSDPASVESVINWSASLQDRVSYVIVENSLSEHADFTYWQEGDLAKEFRRRFRPAIIRQDYRLPDLENAARNYGMTLGRVATRTTAIPELQKASLVMRAQSYRRRIFAEFDKVKDLLLP